jgi:hypothetical protein
MAQFSRKALNELMHEIASDTDLGQAFKAFSFLSASEIDPAVKQLFDASGLSPRYPGHWQALLYSISHYLVRARKKVTVWTDDRRNALFYLGAEFAKDGKMMKETVAGLCSKTDAGPFSNFSPENIKDQLNIAIRAKRKEFKRTNNRKIGRALEFYRMAAHRGRQKRGKRKVTTIR